MCITGCMQFVIPFQRLAVPKIHTSVHDISNHHNNGYKENCIHNYTHRELLSTLKLIKSYNVTELLVSQVIIKQGICTLEIN